MSAKTPHRFRRPPARSWMPVVAAIVTFASIAACVPRTESWSPAASPKTNTLSWVSFSHPVAFPGTSNKLSASEKSQLDQFLAEIDAGYGDHVTIRAPAGVRAKRLAAVAGHLRAIQLDPRFLSRGAESANAGVTVVIGRYLITPPKCPDWTKPPGLDPANRVSSNLGCATATNLGLMLANPGDLFHGGPLSPADGEAAAGSIRRYRNDRIKQLKLPDTIQLEEFTGSGT